MRVLWSDPASDQLEQVRELRLRQAIFHVISGLAEFPEKGRRPPEAGTYPELDPEDDLREIVFPRLCRIFYRYRPKAGVIRVLGFAFAGQQVSREWLAQFLETRGD